MKKWQHWLENLSAEQISWLTAVFVSAMLGTILSALILQWGMSEYGDKGFLAQLIVCTVSTLAYGAAVVAVFYTLIPDTRPNFKRIFSSKK
jgi:uncharacterized membrane protein